MKTYVFPGQGSQFVGMGGDLFDKYPSYTKEADEVLGYSIKNLCLEDPDGVLSETKFTQPALYVVNALSYLNKKQNSNVKTDYFAGHSLGEYNALFSAGAFDFSTGLQLVKKRGELMGMVSGGGMAAVLGSNDKEISEILRSSSLDTIDVANYNSVSQTVLSGLKDDLDKAEGIFESRDIFIVPLAVSAAFHSRHMKSMVNEYASFLSQFTFNDLHTPVIANVSARPYENGEISYNLREQLVNSVQWLETVKFLDALGEMTFEEIGPGDVLKKLVNNIRLGR